MENPLSPGADPGPDQPHHVHVARPAAAASESSAPLSAVLTHSSTTPTVFPHGTSASDTHPHQSGSQISAEQHAELNPPATADQKMQGSVTPGDMPDVQQQQQQQQPRDGEYVQHSVVQNAPDTQSNICLPLNVLASPGTVRTIQQILGGASSMLSSGLTAFADVNVQIIFTVNTHTAKHTTD